MLFIHKLKKFIPEIFFKKLGLTVIPITNNYFL